MRLVSLLVVTLVIGTAEAGKYALVVGVNKYRDPNFSKLDFAVNDAAELAKVLRGNGFEVKELTNAGKIKKGTAPTAKNIRMALRELATGKKKEDMILVALAGHGVRLVIEDPIRPGESQTRCFFCPADAKLTGVRGDGSAAFLIEMGALLREIDTSAAQNKFVLIDACRNQVTVKGLTPRVGKEPGVPYSLDPKLVVAPPGLGALYSCSPGEVAYELEGLGGRGHGIFFHFVLEGLRGRARNSNDEVTFNSLIDYVTAQVPRQVPAMLQKPTLQQTPHQITNLAGASAVLVAARPKQIATGDKMYRTGMDKYLGRGVKIDQVAGIKLLEQAAESGDPLARGWFAWYTLAASRIPTPGARARETLKEVLPAIRRLAIKDDPEAQLLLAWMYGSGEGLERDPKESVWWYRRAADTNGSQAQYQLGLLYEGGTLLARDESLAEQWFRRAAAQDLAFAQHALALKLETKNPAEAAQWHQKAAQADHVGAQFRLAGMYAEGKGVARDEKKAIEWFRKAADGGHPRAKEVLRRLGG